MTRARSSRENLFLSPSPIVRCGPSIRTIAMSRKESTSADSSSSAQGEGIQFRYALSSSGSLVDVTTLTHESRYELAPYECVGCGEELIARLGSVRAKHFKHKTEGSCSPESRLHKLGKRLFLECFLRCVVERTPFLLKREVSEECVRSENQPGGPCRRALSQEIDLTQHYSAASLESTTNGFRPDVLLSSDDGANQLFVEIAVTHSCEAEKIESGARILEIELRGEDDLQLITGCELSAEDPRVTIFNFKDPIKGDICEGPCSEQPAQLKSASDEGALDEAVSAPEPKWMLDANKSSYRESLERDGQTKYSDRLATALLKDRVREALFDESGVLNCFNCRFHGLNRSERPPIFCMPKGVAVDSDEAANCPRYRPFGSASEADKADVRNATFLSQSRSDEMPNRKQRYGR